MIGVSRTVGLCTACGLNVATLAIDAGPTTMPRIAQLCPRCVAGLRDHLEVMAAVPELDRCGDNGSEDREPIHLWFGLTYSSYLVVQRSALQAMPVLWQRKFVALLEEMREHIDTSKLPSSFTVNAREGNKFIKDPFRDYRRGPSVPLRRKA